MFRTGAHVGRRRLGGGSIQQEFDAVLLAGGATVPRDLPVPGRELTGVHFAMEFLTQQNRRNEGDAVPDDEAISAAGKHVVIIGGGDTGADCLGTVHRQGAPSVHQFELLPRPPDERGADESRGRSGRTSSACRPRTRRAGERVYSGVDPAVRRRRRRARADACTP